MYTYFMYALALLLVIIHGNAHAKCCRYDLSGRCVEQCPDAAPTPDTKTPSDVTITEYGDKVLTIDGKQHIAREGIPFYSPNYPAFGDLRLKMHRMRYQRCNRKFPLSYSRLFPEITGNGISDNLLKGTYITPISIGLPQNAIESIVFIADGQQGAGENNTQPSALSGHPDYYKNKYRGKDHCGQKKEFSANPASLYSKLRQTGWFPLNKTYWFHADDSQYNWGYLPKPGSATRKSFTKQICSKVGLNTKRIYLAGASRGGALVLEIAKNIKDRPSKFGCPNMDDIHLYVQTFDAVFKVMSDEEFDVRKQTVPNPLDKKNKKAEILNISKEFTHKNNLKIWSAVGGGKTIAAVRAFTHNSQDCRNNAYCFLDTAGNQKWYQQVWGNYVHTRYTERPAEGILHPALDELGRWLRFEEPDDIISPILPLLFE